MPDKLPSLTREDLEKMKKELDTLFTKKMARLKTAGKGAEASLPASEREGSRKKG